MNKCLILAEKVFTVLSLIYYAGGIVALILSGGVSEGEKPGVPPDNALIQLLFFITYVISFFLLAFRWKKVITILNKDRFITVILGLCFISFLWSAAPTVTLVRSVAILGSSFFGIYIGTRYSLKEQLQLLAWTFGIVVILSFIFIVALPKYGVMSGVHAGKWRGIFTHKNSLGRLMILSGLTFMITALNTQENKFWLWGGFSLSIILLLQSKSSSSMINFLIILIVFLIIKLIRIPYILIIPTILLLALIGQISYLWLLDNTTYLLSSIGKDETLTGRSDLWLPVLDMIGKRPLLGYGYGAFWGGWDREAAYVWRVIGWTAPHSHNGFLDLCLDLGILGLSIFFIGFMASLLKSLVWVRLGKTLASFWPAMYIVYFWLSNLTESALLRQNDVYWPLYVAVILSMNVPLNRSEKSISESV